MAMKRKCRHSWYEVRQKLKGKEIELRLLCAKCGVTLVELYSIDKTYTLDKKGRVAGEIEIYKK